MDRDSPMEKDLENKKSANRFLYYLYLLISIGSIQGKLKLVISHIDLVKTISYTEEEIEIIIDGIIDLFSALGLLDANNKAIVEGIFKNLVNCFKNINESDKNLFDRIFHIVISNPVKYKRWYSKYLQRENMSYIQILEHLNKFTKNIPIH